MAEFIYPFIDQGKSTLLQLLAGKRLLKGSTTKVFGKEVFFNTPPGVCYLGTEWANNPVVRSDIAVSHFMLVMCCRISIQADLRSVTLSVAGDTKNDVIDYWIF